MRYWADNDMNYLEELANVNKITRAEVDNFLNAPYKGRKKRMFAFWKIEKETFEHIQKYKDKKKLIKMVKEREREIIRKYPASKRDAKKAILKDRIPEIIGKKNNNLLKNPYFLGFHIDGEIPKNIKRILLDKYSDKIIFDGKKIKKVGEVLK
jgi:hypothetical protein